MSDDITIGRRELLGKLHGFVLSMRDCKNECEFGRTARRFLLLTRVSGPSLCWQHVHACSAVAYGQDSGRNVHESESAA